MRRQLVFAGEALERLQFVNKQGLLGALGSGKDQVAALDREHVVFELPLLCAELAVRCIGYRILIFLRLFDAFR